MKYAALVEGSGFTGPTPHGVGGLKSVTIIRQDIEGESHPPRGGWIEMRSMSRLVALLKVPPPTGWVD